MSDVKRYRLDITCDGASVAAIAVESEQGRWIVAADYAALQAKHDAAVALLRECREIVQVFATENPRYADVDNFIQDPLRAHEILQYINALTNPKE